MKAKLKELCGIDIRSLAIFRIGLALIILGDLFIRMQDLTAHYTDQGVLPREVLIGTIIDPWYISLHLMNGTWEFQALLFVLAALFAIALLVGYQTRLAAFLSWFFLISLHSRNPMVLQGGDFVLKLLAFWGMFLPLGACWSIDQLKSKIPFCKQIASASSLALLLQIALIYWFSAMLKTDESWRQTGTAVWYSLSIEQYATPLGVYLLQYPNLLKMLTFATFYLEAFGPFFAFTPIWTAPLRFATAIVFILFHLVGLNLAMELGVFSYVCAVGWIVFIPGQFWDRVLKMDDLQPAKEWKASLLSNALALFFLVYIFLLNIRNLEVKIPYFSPKWEILSSLLRLDQLWDMFAPYPLKEDGWFVIPGRLRDGTVLDLYSEANPVSWKKPPLLSAMYSNDRWRSYMMNLVIEENTEVYLLYYAKYLCRQWNRSHRYEKQLIRFDIIFMLKVNDIEHPAANYEKTLLWTHHCF